MPLQIISPLKDKGNPHFIGTEDISLSSLTCSELGQPTLETQREVTWLRLKYNHCTVNANYYRITSACHVDLDSETCFLDNLWVFTSLKYLVKPFQSFSNLTVTPHFPFSDYSLICFTIFLTYQFTFSAFFHRSWKLYVEIVLHIFSQFLPNFS